MLFSSLSFLYFFLPAVIVFYFIGRSITWRNGVLIVASLIFYSWGEPKFLFLMLLSTFLVWICGLLLEQYAERPRLRLALLIASAAMLLALLTYFKYLNFILESFNSFTNGSISLRDIALPAGISFYTFQLLSYLFDLYRSSIKCERKLSRFILYIFFFPQLLQGPILRYGSISEQLYKRNENWAEAIYGMRRFITGLGKKVLLADNIALVASSIYAAPDLSGSAALWLASLCYTLQIYFDFSGYCDMAIGLGRIFGFHLPENFNYPYAAVSVTDFWRRWHITLSQWFRDYVYIPLGGNRVKNSRLILNIMVVWGLTGLWHGASWNFVLWGLFYGLLLLSEKLILGSSIDKIPMILRRLSTLFCVNLGWVLFNISDTQTLLSVLREMFSLSATDWTGLLRFDTSIVSKLVFIPFGIIFSFPVTSAFKPREDNIFISVAVNLCYLGILAVSVMYIISSSFTPFIYFGF